MKLGSKTLLDIIKLADDAGELVGVRRLLSLETMKATAEPVPQWWSKQEDVKKTMQIRVKTMVKKMRRNKKSQRQ